MAPRYRHPVLSGDQRNHRECHVKRDSVLIYRLPDDDTLSASVSGFARRTGLMSEGGGIARHSTRTAEADQYFLSTRT
nr:type II toxin-antitoxin system YafQ family toxin [Methylobacterium sp. OTU13CASTA1]